MEQWTGVHRHHMLDAVFQLAHVAGPLITHHGVDRFSGERVVHSMSRKKVLDERHNVLLALTERHQPDGDHV